MKVGGFVFDRLHHQFRQRDGAFPAFGPMIRQGHFHSTTGADFMDQFQFGLGIAREFINGHDHGHPELLHVVQVAD